MKLEKGMQITFLNNRESCQDKSQLYKEKKGIKRYKTF